MSLPQLPQLMVAPNGARRTRSDHPALPVTIPEIVATAAACLTAGADGLHAHVRDREQRHVLDAGLYRELLEELAAAVPGMPVQITTEAVGRYSPDEQRALVWSVRPRMVSVALREMAPADGLTEARDFYHEAFGSGIAVQHILRAPEEVDRLAALWAEGLLPDAAAQVLFVLGRYDTADAARPADLGPYLDALARLPGHRSVDWAACAFGPQETDCLTQVVERGGKLRVGFENNLVHRDGTLAPDNAARVRELHAATEGADGPQPGMPNSE